MKKVIKLTESDLTKIVKQVLTENKQWLAKFFGSTADDLVKNYGDDAAKSLDDVFSKVFNRGNLISSSNGTVLKSMSGVEVPVIDIQEVIKLVGQGKLTSNQVAKYLPNKLADGSEFRKLVLQAMEKKGSQKVGQQVASKLTPLQSKNLLTNCFHSNYCDVNTILGNFMRKIGNIAKLTKFEPSNVKVLEHTYVSGREIIDTILPNGERVLMYKSTGSNTQTTGKKVGEWFIIPGFAKDGWFFKTKNTIEFTKGGNKYLTEFAQYLEKNGVKGLGSQKSSQATTQVFKDLFKGLRISNNSFAKMKPDFTNITNAKNIDDYNKFIAQAIESGDFSKISAKGFEKFGIPNFRDYLKNNIAKINEVNPTTGRWSVNFK
jgi:hypothetical protein